MRSFLRSCQSAESSKLPISELSQAKEADIVIGTGFWLTKPDLVPSQQITKSQFSFNQVAGVPQRQRKV
ncbi:hypothetical protein L6164_037310 [Bauhinia variegata]|uniref:Uncharacterized protein n=1 Tax=Bauhinia variegata TaxID=167791 RepID=A0ACB9KJP9_BAUVA|nr:hypothetical protein L6164_037310 [Bauhinia variegata]